MYGSNDTFSSIHTQTGEKQGHIRHVDKLFDELAELLEQMELEIKDLPARDKQKYRTRLVSYKAENKKLLADMKRAKLGLNAREDLLGEEVDNSEDQRTRLLDNTEKLERGTRRLDDGYRVILETEEMGAQILSDLSDQRETIQRSRNREVNSCVEELSVECNQMLVNPYSSRVKAMQMVTPMLDEANIEVKVNGKEYAGHGKEIMKKVNKKDYYGVVIVSGDGLIYEVVNGLMDRPDWKDAIKFPIGCLPGGSGNALSCAINYSAGSSQ
ncbi:VTI1A-like protein [Mya arenaria]|uniref:VTI1A-like protein n=1 Tax=Mya arenaria TaxID=6604 RepID=A0ABY7DD02_MYAAR|nr:VTI1A-like protein [Mya arenaria]